MFDRYFFVVDVGNVPLTISVTPCSSVVSMSILWRTMPDDEEYYYYDDGDPVVRDVGTYVVYENLFVNLSCLPLNVLGKTFCCMMV